MNELKLHDVIYYVDNRTLCIKEAVVTEFNSFKDSGSGKAFKRNLNKDTKIIFYFDENIPGGFRGTLYLDEPDFVESIGNIICFQDKKEAQAFLLNTIILRRNYLEKELNELQKEYDEIKKKEELIFNTIYNE